MKRTLITPSEGIIFPSELSELLCGGVIYDSSCSPEARVYYIDKSCGYYLKRSAIGSLSREAEMNRYFHDKGLSVEVLAYLSSGGYDWLLTAKARGEDCTYQEYLSDPKRLAILLGERLRELHSLNAPDCPVQNRMQSYFSLAEENYLKRQYDTSYFLGRCSDPDEIWRIAELGRGELSGRVLLHGDYCLPNVMLDDWKFSAFIDLGGGGIGDPHIDLYWGAWTLNFNLGTNDYRDLFLDAYGRDGVDEEKLLTVSAYEVFG